MRAGSMQTETATQVSESEETDMRAESMQTETATQVSKRAETDMRAVPCTQRLGRKYPREQRLDWLAEVFFIIRVTN